MGIIFIKWQKFPGASSPPCLTILVVVVKNSWQVPRVALQNAEIASKRQAANIMMLKLCNTDRSTYVGVIEFYSMVIANFNSSRPAII